MQIRKIIFVLLTASIFQNLNPSITLADDFYVTNPGKMIYGGPESYVLSPSTDVFRVQPGNLDLVPHKSDYFWPRRYALDHTYEGKHALYMGLDEDHLNKLRKSQGYFDGDANKMFRTKLGDLMNDLDNRGYTKLQIFDDSGLRATTGGSGIIIIADPPPPGFKPGGGGGLGRNLGSKVRNIGAGVGKTIIDIVTDPNVRTGVGVGIVTEVGIRTGSDALGLSEGQADLASALGGMATGAI